MTILVIEDESMTSWGATQAKAKFSEVLDQAQTLGPQRIQRRKERFIVMKEEEYLQHKETLAEPAKPFISGWDALKPSSGVTIDFDLTRLRGKARKVSLE